MAELYTAFPVWEWNSNLESSAHQLDPHLQAHLMASCVLQRCRRNQALAKLSQAKSCTSLIPHSAAGTGWVDGLQTNSSVDPLPSSFSTQNTAPLSATKSSSITEPARAALSNRILPPPAFVWLRIHHCPACIPATRQLPHVLLSQHTCWWP